MGDSSAARTPRPARLLGAREPAPRTPRPAPRTPHGRRIAGLGRIGHSRRTPTFEDVSVPPITPSTEALAETSEPDALSSVPIDANDEPRRPRVIVLAPKNRRSLIRIAALALAALVVAGGVAYLAVRLGGSSRHHTAQSPTHSISSSPSGKSTSARRSTLPRVLAEAVHWVDKNLVATASVIADSSSAPELRARGVDASVVVPLIDHGGARARYVLWTNRLRREGGEATSRYLFRHSVRIARFGTGQDRTEVRQLAIKGVARLRAASVEALAARRRAGAELLRNPEVRVVGSSRAALRSGSLDLRAATVLALLADRSAVWVMSVDRDPHAASASDPSRVLRIRTIRANAVAATLAGTPRRYRPSDVIVEPDGTRMLTWLLPAKAQVPIG